jgi:hypothetical protein
MLLGWPPGGVETYAVALVTDPAEMEQAARELSGGCPTSYVALRVDEGEGSSANRGRSLRMLIEDQHFLCRPPTPAEREALEKGLPGGTLRRAASSRRPGACRAG